MKKCAVLLLLCLAGLSIFASPEPEMEGAITIAGLKGPSSIALIDMVVREGRTKAMLAAEVDFEVVPVPDKMVGRIMTGEVDVAAVPVNIAANLFNKGAEYKLLAITGTGVLYILSSDENVEKLTDLEGETIYGIGKGSNPEFVLQTVLEGNKLADEIKVDYKYDHTEIAAQMISGRIKHAMVPEPMVSQILLKKEDVHIIADLQAEWAELEGEAYPATAIIVKNSFIEEQPHTVTYLAELIRDSVEAAMADPAGTAKNAEKRIKLPADAIEAGHERLGLTFIEAQDAKESVLKFLKVLYQLNPESIGSSIPGDDFFIDLEQLAEEN